MFYSSAFYLITSCFLPSPGTFGIYLGRLFRISPLEAVLFVDVTVAGWIRVALPVHTLALLDPHAVPVDVLVHAVGAEALLVAVLRQHAVHAGG